MDKLTQYLKAFVPLIATIVAAVQAALSDGEITDIEWRDIGVLALTTFLVWLVPNKQPEA